MIGRLKEIRGASLPSRYGFRLVLVISAVAYSVADQAQAQNQLTSSMIIGDAVSEVGTRYADVDQAIQRFTNRDVLGARAFLEAAKRKDASLPPVDLLLAKMYYLTGNAVGGRASLEKTAMENPGDPEVYLILADQSIQPPQNRTIEAEALYDKALPLIEKFTGNAKRKRNFAIRARTGRALVYERRRDWAAAAADLSELLKVEPNDATAHYRLGRALFMQKKTRDGYNEFVKARELDKQKEIPNAFVAAALMYDQLGQTNEAQQAFDRAVAAEKNDVNTQTAYAQWLIKTGSLQKAETILAEATKANPASLNLLILSGVAARMNKKMKPAEDHFMEALRISPANADVINQLALLLIDQPDDAKRQRALQFAAINAKVNEQSGDARITYAWVLYKLGRMAEAEAALREGLQFGSLNPDSQYLVAKVLTEQNPPRTEAAKQILAQALDAENTGIFINRREAQSLLETLNKS